MNRILIGLLPLSFLLFHSCRKVIPRGVPGAEYVMIHAENGRPVSVEKKFFTVYQPPNPKPPRVSTAPPTDKTHPTIDAWLNDSLLPDNEKKEIMIGLLPPKSVQSAYEYLRDFERTLVNLGGEEIRPYDSIYTFRVSLPLRALRRQLRDDSRIRYIEPNRVPLTEDMIPALGNSGDRCKKLDGYAAPAATVSTIQSLAQTMNLASFATPPGAHVALLDSGLNSHSMLPATGISTKNCLTQPCTTTGGGDGCLNHGTPNSGILIANGAGGNPRGVLQGATIHSFKVTEQTGGPGSCTSFGVVSAVVEALNTQITGAGLPVDVILTETLVLGPAHSAISLAVDSAFDAGYPVIAAADAETAKTRSPANAHKAFPISSTAKPNSYETADLRTIPIVWAHSESETTSGVSAALPYCMQDGSSGAAPFAAAAAVKVRHFLSLLPQPPLRTEPGYVYAMLLALAKKTVVAKRQLYLPAGGTFYAGSFDVSNGGEAYAYITVAHGQKLRAAVWWPESAVIVDGKEIHNQIQMEIAKPSGHSVPTHTLPDSVFQYKAVEDFPHISGDWIVKITGLNVTGIQRIYWAGYAGNW